MRHNRTVAFLSIGLGLAFAACAAGVGTPTSPQPSPIATTADPLVEVRAALLASGIAVVDARETSSSEQTFSCLSSSMRSFTFDEEAAHATFRPGEKPPIDALAFPSPAERQAAQRGISGDGTQLTGSRCAAMIDWITTPHWTGGGRYLLLVVSSDSGLAAQVAAAAARLGPP